MEPDSSAAHEALIQFLYRAPIGLLQATMDGEVTMVNPMAAQLLMPLAPRGDLSNLFDVLAPLAPALRALALASDPAGGVVCDGLRLPLGPMAGPGLPPQTLSLSLTRLDAATLMASVSDATYTLLQEQQRLASQMHDFTRIDVLTSLPNRTVVRERIEHALACARVDPGALFAVAFINVDRFNLVNVLHGTAAGDDLLRQMGRRLHATVRPGDAVGRAAEPASTAARLGGDEFVVVLEGLRSADAVPGIAQRLIDVLARPYDIGSNLGTTTLHMAVSVGVVVGDATAGHADAVLQDASIAMREAKRAGGARAERFCPAMKERASRRGTVENELRRALAEGELYVVYQPLVRLSDGLCNGAEALVRWRHPTRGTVPPLEFIDIAEETGLIGALGAYVLATACRQFVHWQQALGAQAPTQMSVNLSRAQLADPALVDQVRAALADCRMDPARLQLEVTESLAAQDEQVRTQLQALKRLGLQIALDDFGTGYSSLSSLHQLPVDVVKIDRSFVQQIETSPHHCVLVEATVRVARSLGMATVAEGIETAGQAAALRRLQCDKGQGYLFGKPMPADEATRWLAGRIVHALA